MDLGNFKREAPGDYENIVVIATFWVCGINESIRSFKSKSSNAVSTVRKYVSHLDEVAKECGVVTTMGVIAGVVCGAMVIWGTTATPLTGGLSLGLT